MAMTAGVNTSNIPMEEWNISFNLESNVAATDVGKAVELDSAGANTVKLASDGGVILGRLETFEDRIVEGNRVGTVALKGFLTLPYTGTAPTVGARVIGGGSGNVKTQAAVTVSGADAAAVGTSATAAIATALAARRCQVFAVDTVAGAVTVLLD